MELQGCTNNCQLKPPVFSLYGETSYHGYFGSSQVAFYFSGKFFVYELVPDRTEAFITYCDVKVSSSNYFVVKAKEVYMNYEVKDRNILEMKLIDKFLSIRTNQELIFYRFEEESAIPKYISSFSLQDLDITNFNIDDKMNIFLTNSRSIMKLNSINQTLSFTSYKTKNGQVNQIIEPSSFTTCENIAFFTEKNRILAFDSADEDLNVLREFIEESDILQIAKVGRSLLVLTESHLIEYIFINDCLDLKKNNMVVLRKLGISEAKKEDLFIEGDSNSSYFLLLNKLTDTFYVFQSASVPDVLATPYIYSHSDPTNGILSARVQEQYNEFNQVEIVVSMSQNDNIVTSISLNKVPESVECQSWISKTAECLVDFELNFCNNDMFNYTALLKNSNNIANDQGIETDNKMYFDPNHLCKRVVQLELKFGWSIKFLVGVSASVFGILALGIMGYLFCQKKKKLLQLTKKDHVEFDNEDNRVSGISEHNREHTPGGGASDRPIRIVHHSRMPDQRWKNFAEKKHLSVKVPRQLNENGNQFIPK